MSRRFRITMLVIRTVAELSIIAIFSIQIGMVASNMDTIKGELRNVSAEQQKRITSLTSEVEDWNKLGLELRQSLREVPAAVKRVCESSADRHSCYEGAAAVADMLARNSPQATKGTNAGN